MSNPYDPFPGAAVVQGQWATIRAPRELVYLDGDRVLDWDPKTGDYKIWEYDRTVVGKNDPFPGAAVVQGQWATIRGSHKLVYLGGDRVLDWDFDGKFKIWAYDRNVTGKKDPFPGAPIVSGKWGSILQGDGAELIYLGGDMVLEWRRFGNPVGRYRIWKYDRTVVGDNKDPLPGDPLVTGQWGSIAYNHDLVYLDGDRVLDWETSTGVYRIWKYDRTVVGDNKDPLPNPPIVHGQWATIRGSRKLVYLGGDRVLDWEPATGNYRIWKYDRTVTSPPENHPPTVNDVSVSTGMDRPISISLQGSDPDPSDPVVIGIASRPQHGYIDLKYPEPIVGGSFLLNNSNVIYTPNKSYVGNDKFSYVARDTYGAVSNQATINISVVQPPPIISDFSPARARVGTAITIHGSNFSKATAVKFNGVSANFNIGSDTTITTTVPANATDGPITITTPSGNATSSNNFDVDTTVTQVPANLGFINTWVDPTEHPSPGQPFVVYFRFANNGGTSSGQFTIRLELDNNSLHLEVPAPSYAPGAGDNVYWYFSQGLPAGDHFIYAYLDFYNKVTETYKTDNISYHGFRVE